MLVHPSKIACRKRGRLGLDPVNKNTISNSGWRSMRKSAQSSEMGRASLICLPFWSTVTHLLFTSLFVPALNFFSTIDFCCYSVGSFFCVRVPDIISRMNNKTNSSRNNMLIKFYIWQWTFDNVITKNIVTPFQKNCATCVYVLFRSI